MNDALHYAYQHDVNKNFLESHVPGNVLNAIYSNENRNEMIMISDSLIINADTVGVAAYASYSGEIVVRSDYFQDSICHELGHHFDDLSNLKIGNLSFYRGDYTNTGTGKWDKLAKEYADEIYEIRYGANISTGYSAEAMKEKSQEFYAEAFQLYFYSDETRAALPERIKDTLEFEINKYASE